MDKSTQPTGNRDKQLLPLLPCNQPEDSTAFLIDRPSFFTLAFFPWQLLQYFSQIQLESFTDMHTHTEAFWNFLFSGDGTPQPLAYKVLSIIGLSKHTHYWPHVDCWHVNYDVQLAWETILNKTEWYQWRFHDYENCFWSSFPFIVHIYVALPCIRYLKSHGFVGWNRTVEATFLLFWS